MNEFKLSPELDHKLDVMVDALAAMAQAKGPEAVADLVRTWLGEGETKIITVEFAVELLRWRMTERQIELLGVKPERGQVSN